MTATSYKKNREWADKYIPVLRPIISEIAGVILAISPAPEQEDLENAVDLVITVESGRIACRIRRVKYVPYKDITIRSWNCSGVPTEIDKLKKKLVRWYLYVYVNDMKEKVVDWYLIDIFQMLQADLLANRETVYNADGLTGFVPIPLQELENTGCIVASQMKPKLTQFAKANIADFHSAYIGQQGGI